VRAGLVGTRFAELRWVDETGSTNADLLDEARRSPSATGALVAESQTAGRGRLGRTWQAPAGSSLLLSVLARPPLAPTDAHLTTTAVALAAADAVAATCGVEPGLKWPNDLVLDPPEAGSGAGTRKLGGILAESIVVGDRLDAVVVGLGLNVNWPDRLPAELAHIATALNHRTGAPVDRAGLAVAVLVRVDERLDALDRPDGRHRLVEEYRRRCASVGRDVRVVLADGELVGRAVGIDDDGHLEVVDDGGHARVVTVGDVVHLRPRA
jgi:BirA family biotin operon repressor/biotin-[acetyl-CoA-carboxylase] ligase